jgi:hypothetical protein
MSRNAFSRLLVALVFAGLFCSPAAAETTITDTFSRPDSNDLGTVESHAYPWHEYNTLGVAFPEGAEISGGQMVLNGGPTSNDDHIQAVLGAPVGDVNISFDMSFALDSASATGTLNSGGVMLGKPRINSAVNDSGDEGQILVEFLPSGGVQIRQQIENSFYPAIYQNNPFLSGDQSGGYDFQYFGSSLPTTFNGQPFDVDGDGRLEADEPFNFTASLAGTVLDLAINGQSIVNVNVSPVAANTYASVIRNKKSYDGNFTPASPHIDNVSVQTAETAQDVVLNSTQMIWDQAPHNAFTDMIKYNGEYYVTFREGSSHVSTDGTVRIIKSGDLQTWTSVETFHPAEPGTELRDGHLSVTPDGGLMMIGTDYDVDDTDHRRNSWIWTSPDGNTWTQSSWMGEDDMWIFSNVWADGNNYALGYDTRHVDPVIRMYSSSDPNNLSTYIEDMGISHYGDLGEPSLIELRDGRMVSLIRNYPLGGAIVGITDDPNYEQWQWSNTGVIIGGPAIVELPDGRIIAGVRLYDGGYRTSLCWLDPNAGTLEEFLELPSEGDTSYPSFVYEDGTLLMSYYSSHEGSSKIYLAELLIDRGLEADFNGDGVVDLTDLTIMGSNYGGEGKYTYEGDADENGVVDLTDLTIMGSQYGQADPPSGGSGVPEPATMALLAVGGAALLRRRHPAG